MFNFSSKFQFSTQLKINDKTLEEIRECKLLGLIISNNLSFDKNTQEFVKKGYTRMIILHKLYEFNLPISEMVNIYILFIRSILEQSCIVWHSSISQEDSNSLERVQKTALRIILGQEYIDYQTALIHTGLLTLKQRRADLCLQFAIRNVKNGTDYGLFPKNVKTVNTRPHEKFFVTPARTERLAMSAVPYMQRLLNQHF